MNSKVLGLSEVVLNVTNIDRSTEFFQQALGFSLHSSVSLETTTPDPEGRPTIVFLTITETQTPLGRHQHPQLLALIDFRRHVYSKERWTAISPQTSPLNHVAFEVPPGTLPEWTERLENLGLEVTPFDFPAMNASALFFSDPDGNRLELICHVENLSAGED